jgi:hypothetical protein
MYIPIIVALAILITIPISNVFATGIRGDSGDDATLEESKCWVNGYDSGFAGKYDNQRARDCINEDNNYNKTWTIGCEDSTRTEAECGVLINNPVEIQDYEALKSENDRTCYDAGVEDGKASTYNKDRDDGCYEFDDLNDGYEGGFQFGCETHTAESSCELMYEDKHNYCPNHPDVVGCVDFLHNATNKDQREVLKDPSCAQSLVSCPNEINAERYCLNTNDPAFCKTIGDICDEDGFVKPEYPYCTK